MASEAIFGAQNITTKFCFSPGLEIYVTSARMEKSVHQRFQAPGEPREGVTHTSRSEFCLVFSLIVFQATLAENVWPSHSKSVHSQVSGTWICTNVSYTSFSPRVADAISVKTLVSGGFRNLERGVQPLAREAQPKMVGVPHPLPVT